MQVRTIWILILLLLPLMMLAGCVPGDGAYSDEHPAGFFWGIWHGWIAPITLIWGFFDHAIRIYEKANTGWWYDFGFYTAILGGFGGLSLSRKKKKGRSEEEQND